MVSFTFVVVVVVDVSCERANIQQAVCSCGRTVTNRCLYPTIAHVFCRRTHQVVRATINSLCSHPTPSYKERLRSSVSTVVRQTDFDVTIGQKVLYDGNLACAILSKYKTLSDNKVSLLL